jgi:hypothetical protein
MHNRCAAILILLLPLALGSCGDLFGPSHVLSLHLEAEVLAPGAEARLVLVNHGRREVRHWELRCAWVQRSGAEDGTMIAPCTNPIKAPPSALLSGGGRVEYTFIIDPHWAVPGETYWINVPAFRGDRDVTPYTDEFRIEAAAPAAAERTGLSSSTR